MKVLIFAGTHPRHLFFHKAVVDTGVDYFAVIMKREDLIPIVPKNILEQDARNFERHFNDLYQLLIY